MGNCILNHGYMFNRSKVYKGCLVKLSNGRYYRALKNISDNTGVLFQMTFIYDDKGRGRTDNSFNYNGSVIDTGMTNYYNSLPSIIKNAIIPQSISNGKYIRENSNLSSGYKIKHFDVYNSRWQSMKISAYPFETLTRYVYTISFQEMAEYLGPVTYSTDELKMFFNGPLGTTESEYFWNTGVGLRDVNGAGTDVASPGRMPFDGGYSMLDYNASKNGGLQNYRPTFAINLNQTPYEVYDELEISQEKLGYIL